VQTDATLVANASNAHQTGTRVQRLREALLADSNRRPPYHGASVATGRNPRQRFSPVCAVFAAVPFATGCHQLRPLGSIKAPSSVVYLGYAVEAPFAALPGARCSLPKGWILSITRVLLAAWTLSICYEA
jgi:hypothetical protein